jgi:signal transduction histidine kinase
MRNQRKSFLKKLMVMLVGDENVVHFDQRFINSVSLGIALTTFIGFIIDILLQLGHLEIILSLICSLLYFFVYCLSRIFNKVNPAKWIAILSAYILLSLLWINSAGSVGPIPYTYFLLVLSIILLTDRWSMGILLSLLVLDILVLFFFEDKFPELLINYKSDLDRRIDLTTGILLYFALGTIIMIYTKDSYKKEKQKAENADKLKTAFLANMSHEIRTPMNAIMGFTGLLRNHNLSKEKREQYYKIVDESVDYLLRLIDDILDISRIEADELVIRKATFDLDEFLKFLELSHQHMIPENKTGKLRLYYENPGIKTLLLSDRTRVEQVLSNLICNAVKFTNEGYVKFGFRPQEDEILFYIQDTGTGIDEKDRDRVFERFVKIEDPSFEILHRGTGIGLSIARKMVELLGGRIWIESTVSKGSAFYFTIPFSK